MAMLKILRDRASGFNLGLCWCRNANSGLKEVMCAHALAETSSRRGQVDGASS